MITVQHKFIRTTPRKIRLVLDSIRGLGVNAAEMRLRVTIKQSARDVYAAVHAAKAAAKDRGFESENWVVTGAICDEGPRLKRRIFASRGRARPIQKHMAHIRISIGPKPTSTKATIPVVKKAAKQDKEQ